MSCTAAWEFLAILKKRISKDRFEDFACPSEALPGFSRIFLVRQPSHTPFQNTVNGSASRAQSRTKSGLCRGEACLREAPGSWKSPR